MLTIALLVLGIGKDVRIVGGSRRRTRAARYETGRRR